MSPLTRFPSSSPETGGTTETETEKRAARHRHRCRHRHTREDDTNRPATQPTPLPKDFSRPTVPTRPDTDQPSRETGTQPPPFSVKRTKAQHNTQCSGVWRLACRVHLSSIPLLRHTTARPPSVPSCRGPRSASSLGAGPAAKGTATTKGRAEVPCVATPASAPWAVAAAVAEHGSSRWVSTSQAPMLFLGACLWRTSSPAAPRSTSQTPRRRCWGRPQPSTACARWELRTRRATRRPRRRTCGRASATSTGCPTGSRMPPLSTWYATWIVPCLLHLHTRHAGR